MGRVGVPSRRVPVAAKCRSSLRFVDVLRSHERNLDLRLHDVSRSSDAFVWRFRCRELILSQDAGLPAWRSHSGIMALPDMVVDGPVLDRSPNGAWSRGHVCVRVAGDIPGAVEERVFALKAFATGHLSAISVSVENSHGLGPHQMPTKPLIAYANVGKTFDGGRVVAVDDVSLEVAEGEFLAIVGGSGSGKTTLLRLANRLIEADSGSITVEGEDVRNVDPILLRRRIGYVFQSGGLFPHLTVADNIGITPKLLGTPPAEISARVDELLDLVRLERAQYRDRLPHELSGGQRQRVGVARALAAKPRIVLMDEPFGALDPLTRDALSDDFRELHRTLGLTTVMGDHDRSHPARRPDRGDGRRKAAGAGHAG